MAVTNCQGSIHDLGRLGGVKGELLSMCVLRAALVVLIDVPTNRECHSKGSECFRMVTYKIPIEMEGKGVHRIKIYSKRK